MYILILMINEPYRTQNMKTGCCFCVKLQRQMLKKIKTKDEPNNDLFK